MSEVKYYMSGVVEDLVIPPFDFNSAMEGGTYSSFLGPSYTSLFLKAEDKFGVTLNLFSKVYVVQVSR